MQMVSSTTTEPLQQWENNMLLSLVRRQVSTSADKRTLKCQTPGQPLTFCRVTTARKPASEVTDRTARRRAQELQTARRLSSGGGGGVQHQLARELQLVPRETLKEMLQHLKLTLIRIPDGHLLSAKTDLNMTWSQTRELKRWLKANNIQCESEITSRRIAGAMLAEQEVQSELLPFTVKDADGCRTVELRPAAAVTSLKATVLDYLKRSAEEGDLTWHDGAIPENEIWVKILADHGGESFKNAFQVLNTKHPKTVVFSLFRAKDTRENIMTGNGQIAAGIEELKDTVWKLPDGRDARFRLFAAGDYALLSTWYGISGACGVRPCLYCEVKKVSMHLPKEDRELLILKRTLERLDMQYHDFMERGKGNRQEAKHYKNVIAPAMFRIPIDQVCIPGLHVTLGLYNKLYDRLEHELNDLDAIIATNLVRRVLPDPDVDQAQVLHHHSMHGLIPYVVAVEEARQIDEEVEAIKEEIEELENNLAWAMLYADTDVASIMRVKEEVDRLMEKKETLERKSKKVKEKGKVTTTNGPLAKRLDEVLQKRRVQRQAYQGKSFIGNHVHAMLKEDAIEDLTSIAKVAAEEIVTEMEGIPLIIVTKAQQIHLNFKRIMSLFAACYKGYSHANPMSEDDILALDRNIRSFIDTFRELFPTMTFPIKLHLLEDHMVEWVSRWGFGIGFHGEQGIESTHAAFNQIQRSTSGIADPVRRLKATLENHLLRVSPSHHGGVPAPKPRNFKV
ncbi:uncharacterized protein LOC144879578 [Branchiostoma floridae x Branchiostoma japonicum]